MSRRKQARPVRLLEEDGGVSPDPIPQTATPLDRENENSSSCSEDDISLSRNLTSEPHMCPRCHEQFTEMTEFVEHRVQCDNKARLHHELEHSDPEDMLVSGDEDEEECGGKRLEQVRRNRQDAANNNSVEEQDETCGEPSEEGQQPVGFPFPVPSAAAGHVTLEALQNTKVAVAQFAATAMANNVDNEAALQELAVLQSTLFTLQHQQVLQLQLINQLQHQLSLNRPKESNSTSPPVSETQTTPGSSIINPPPSSPPPPRIPIIIPSPREPTPPIINETPTSQSLPPTQISIPKTDPVIISQPPPPITIPPPTPPPLATQVPLCSISSAFAESIITNNDPPPSLDEPNTLEMLQRRAQEVLDNASQGLLANNLADELAFRKGKGSMSPYDSKSGRNEPFFKHRCRYCGKVFGSDSALQIHIRSHTGERPFKCNVCGSRFTTKGNLKVHFQRHTAKFPHIKMNPNPVPEHLDKYHPPLLAQLGQNQPVSPGLPPHQSHPLQFPNTHPFSLYRPPPGPHDLLPPRPLMSPQRPPDNQIRTLPPHPLFVRRGEQEVPENLSKPPRSPSPAPSPVQREILENRCKSEPIEDTPQDQPSRRNSESRSEDVDIAPKQEPDNEIENEHENPDNEIVPRFPSPTPYDDCSIDSKYSNDDMMGSDSPLGHDEQIQDQPENLSSKSSFAVNQLPMSAGQRIPASFPFSHAVSPPSSTSSGSLGTFPIPPPSSDPSKDPAVYTSLLPRPGSNDNSWESLIEVTKTSETSKLQQLVDNIEHKLTDPNQCVICHRVLSCKSALQMHYRTHTGERPFKCKICGRAFTTKGNLKTHMGVHRAKPPMRVLHQCPVCHKKFTNALVLQQHIRLHTGEPTDLTPEQIQAAEVKDFPSPGGFPLPNPMNPFLSQGFSIPGLSPLGPPGFPLNMKSDLEGMKDEHQEFMEEDEDDDDESSTTTEQHMPSFSTSLAALENQVRTITTVASQLSASHLSGLSQSNEDLCNSRTMTSTPTHQNGDKSPEMSIELSPNNSDVRCSPPQIPNMRPPSSQRATSPTPSESNSLGALDLTPRSSHLPEQNSISPGPTSGPPLPPHPGVFSNFGLLPPTPTSGPLMTSALSSLTSSVLTSTAFSPLGLAVGPAVRGNTTCNLCFKTFACNSALEIHYRSHTKERPFKCTVCDRGFSTKGSIEGCLCSAGQGRIQDNKCQEKSKPKKVRKRTHDTKTSLLLSSASKIQNASTRLPLSLINPGYATASEWMRPFLLGNMKQHMLTHKIRDMPQHMFEKPPMTQPPTHLPPPPSLPPPSLPVKEDQRTTILPPEKSNNSNDQPDREREITSTSQPPVHLSLPEIPIKAEINIKRSPSETDLPVSKRPSSSHGDTYVEQRSIPTRTSHVTRSSTHSNDAQGFRISPAETRSFLSIPSGSIP